MNERNRNNVVYVTDLQDNFEMAEEMADGHLFDAYTGILYFNI